MIFWNSFLTKLLCTAASVLLLNSAKHLKLKQTFPTDIQLFKVNNGNTDTIWEIYSKLAKKDKRTSLTSFWCLYCWNWTDFRHFSVVFHCWFWNKTPKNPLVCLDILRNNYNSLQPRVSRSKSYVKLTKHIYSYSVCFYTSL